VRDFVCNTLSLRKEVVVSLNKINMVDINAWLEEFLQKLNELFKSRVWFVGLQGSYGRGEATETSDIDVVVILNEFTVADIQAYNQLLDTLPHRELICGFVSGKDEILNWEPADLFQFYHDTTPIKGSLDELLPKIDSVAVDRAIKIGACNIYHGCVHNMLHTKNEDILKGLYKAASFVVQAIVFKQTGDYIKYQNQLLQAALLDEKIVIETFLKYKNCETVDFNSASEILFEWSKKWISK
jgi:predicted nucleotidyltransferase